MPADAPPAATASTARWPLWALILAAGAITAGTVGLRQVVGLYMPPVTQSLGIGVEPFSRAMAMASLLWGIGGVFAGAIADRIGAGRLVAAGILLMIVGYLAMYLARTGDELIWSGIAIGTGVGVCGLSVMVGVIGRAAPPEQRTSAIAALGMANGIGNFIAFPYTHLLMELLGWKGSILAVMATLAALLPCAWLLSGKPAPQEGTKPQTLREAFGEAFRLPSYLLLIAGFFVCGFHVGFYAVHLPTFVASRGLPSWVGMAALTVVGIANILGTYMSGRWARRYEKRLGLSLIYLTRCFVFLGLLYLPINEWTVIASSAVLGLFWLATMPLTSGLVAQFFGTAWLSMLFGIVSFSHQLGGFCGVWLAGYLFDATRSYDTMWWIAIALGLLAALVHWPIREEPVARLRSRPA